MLLCEYDPSTHVLRIVVNITDFLDAVGARSGGMQYAPAKTHGHIDLGKDGWLYYSTYMGGTQGSEGSDDRHDYS